MVQPWELSTEIGIILGFHKLVSELTTEGREAGRWRLEYPTRHAISVVEAAKKTKSTTGGSLMVKFEP